MKYCILILIALVVVAPGATVAQFTNGQAADVVLGQSNFTSSGHSTSATGMYFPVAVAVDPTTGKVFVGEAGNFRILRFGSAATLTSGQAAEGVLGQPNFTSTSHGVTQTTFGAIYAMAFDAAGNLYVSDNAGNRILRFNNASAKADGAAADAVLGQPNFTSNAAATTQNGLNSPRCLR